MKFYIQVTTKIKSIEGKKLKYYKNWSNIYVSLLISSRADSLQARSDI